ncbi:MAG: VWA domain-containing protein [Janthinobacterium lividum]
MNAALARLRNPLLAISLLSLSTFGLLAQTAATPASAAPGQTPAPSQLPATAPSQLPGQTPNQAPALSPRDGAGPTTTIQVFSREVNLVFTVTDNKGRFVTSLPQQQFGLLDDGRPPARVVRFQQQSNLPLRVGIMLDTSNSIRSRFDFEQQAAIDFFLQILRPADRAFVEGFDVQTDIAQDYTNRVDLLDTGIHKLRPGGGTSLFDSLYKTCRDQMLTLKDQQAVRRALVLVSDGDDDYSRSQESDAIKMCQRAETIIYAISTNTGPSKDKGDDVLQRIADATGGRAFFPTRMEDMATGFANVEQELRSQYSLEYVPADFRQDGAFRTIYLVSLDGRYQVHARKGYFAPRLPQ